MPDTEVEPLLSDVGRMESFLAVANRRRSGKPQNLADFQSAAEFHSAPATNTWLYSD